MLYTKDPVTPICLHTHEQGATCFCGEGPHPITDLSLKASRDRISNMSVNDTLSFLPAKRNWKLVARLGFKYQLCLFRFSRPSSYKTTIYNIVLLSCLYDPCQNKIPRLTVLLVFQLIPCKALKACQLLEQVSVSAACANA